MVTSAREIMESREFEVELPTLGWTIRCRKIGNLELALSGVGGVIGFAEVAKAKDRMKTEKKIEEMTPEEQDQFWTEEFTTSRKIVMASAIEPRVTDRAWDEIDKDEEIHISVLDRDVQYLALEVLKQSGLMEEPPEIPFRGDERADDDASSPDGGSVWDTSVGTVDATSGGPEAQPTGVSHRDKREGQDDEKP